MVVLNRIYTRTGDKGETALGDGTRVAKDGLRVTAYGTVDELNSTLGLARLHAAGEPDAGLERVQNDLFDLGADLCTPDFENDATAKHPRLRIVAGQVGRLEAEIDAMNARLRPLRSFVLPGGSALAAAEPVNPQAARSLNRLPDWLFVAARVANDGGAGDLLWVPGANR
ncbi:MAG TPA: cob(I)yrinic acid a,c-diamide adenosyltransferase [Amaricoccus sp.]|nr:cob(I)yrinic acid a,c-diamide adenosyltransferase [Amaricoccus sp.]